MLVPLIYMKDIDVFVDIIKYITQVSIAKWAKLHEKCKILYKCSID